MSLSRYLPFGSTRPNTQPVKPADWQTSETWVRFGRSIVFWLVGGLVVFAAIVSISGAVVAVGRVTVESAYQTIQHPEGGVVREILVKNGDRVSEGQTLVVLDATAARANYNVSRSRIKDLAIQRARLIAERDNLDDFPRPGFIRDTDTKGLQVFEAQYALFAARRKSRTGEQSVLDQRIRQLGSELGSLRSQLAARQRERRINAKELETVTPLYERGYVSQQRLAPLQREAARLDGELGRLKAEQAKIGSALEETRLRKAQADKQFINEVVDELSRVQRELEEQRQLGAKYKQTMERTRITAPRAGIVHALAAKTIGGVVRPAAPIAQIIPEGERLVVEAELATRDIDQVSRGQTAVVQFPAFNAHTTPRLTGIVERVDAAETEDRTGRLYYTARITIPAEELLKLGAKSRLVPGMPSEVFIQTTSRSILSYILKPLTDAMSRAFRES